MSWRIQLTGPRCQHSLALPTQGITVVFGHSGSGKTSLLLALAGLAPSPGEIYFNDQCWQAEDRFMTPAQRHLAMAFQEPRLLPHLSAEQNIRLGPHLIDQQNFQHWVSHLGLAPLLKKRASQLSGGEQQRVSLARALLKPSQALLLDEPFTGLDRKRRHQLIPALKIAAKAKPIVIVTHELEELLALADYLVLVDHSGSVSGPITERLNHPLITQQRGHVVSILRAQPAPASSSCGLQNFDIGSGLQLRIATDHTPSAPYIAVDARDVSLTLSRAQDTSILNILPVTVTAIDPSIQGVQQVHLRMGEQSLVAQLSSHSVAHLQLTVGMNVFAQVKGTVFVGR